ncbi:Plant lipid transfer protein/Par allergen protein [Raphanus sativus]|nr:Plant lipid transfer protein/Par allergen protein [Raphanus sativus]
MSILKNLPCVSYLTSGSGKPPATCCEGVQKLDAATTTSADKKEACECIKSVASTVTVKPELAKLSLAIVTQACRLTHLLLSTAKRLVEIFSVSWSGPSIILKYDIYINKGLVLYCWEIWRHNQY